MKRFVPLLILLSIMVACSPGDPPLAEQAAIEMEVTAVLPTPTLNTPRLEAATLPSEPTQPTATSDQVTDVVPTNPPTPELIPTETAVVPEPAPTEPPAEAEVLAAEEVSGVIYGRTVDGAFFHGDPNAPITMIDYSDFL